MQLDNKLSLDESTTGRDHRSRARSARAGDNVTTPGTRTEMPTAGGAVPVSRPEQGGARDATDEGRQQPANAARDRAEEELERMLRLPRGTRLHIDVDFAKEEVRFQVRNRETGLLVLEIPAENSVSLLKKLEEFAGALVDRSL